VSSTHWNVEIGNLYFFDIRDTKSMEPLTEASETKTFVVLVILCVDNKTVKPTHMSVFNILS
jgi:hypothetical protein